VRWSLSVNNLTDKRYVRALTGADNVWQGPRRRLMIGVDWAR
jgi:outer membrane receptor protein involved in Fe transport